MQTGKDDFNLLSLPSTGTVAKASSVLQKNAKLYGPMNALDCDNALTCWNSEGNPMGKTSSFLTIDFGRVVAPIEVAIQFQAGFVAEELTISKLDSNTEEWVKIAGFEVEDDHEAQSFSLASGDSDSTTTTALKLEFDECTDFYGRVTVYTLQVWGREVVTQEAEDKA